CEAILHLLHLFGSVALPVGDLRNDPQWIPRAVGERRVSWKLLISEVRVVDDRAGGLHDVNPFRSTARRELGTPNRRIQGAGEVHPGECLAFSEVGRAADL